MRTATLHYNFSSQQLLYHHRQSSKHHFFFKPSLSLHPLRRARESHGWHRKVIVHLNSVHQPHTQSTSPHTFCRFLSKIQSHINSVTHIIQTSPFANMQLSTLHLFTFALLFTTTVLTSVISDTDPAPADLEKLQTPPGIDNGSPADFEIPLHSLLEGRGSCPPDCGSSPFQQPCRPCNSATGLNMPFRFIFKLPVLLINAITFSTKIRAAAVTLPSTSELERSIEKTHEPADYVLPLHDLDDLFERSCKNGDGWSQFPCSAASGLEVPSIFKLPALVFSTISALPGAIAAALPASIAESNEEREAENVPSSPELSRLDVPSIQSLFPHEQRMAAMLQGRDFPDYCSCNEDSCGESPACCANASCPPNGFIQFNAAPGHEIPSVFKLSVVLLNAISAIPASFAAATPSTDETLSSVGAMFERGQVRGTLGKRQDGGPENLCYCTESDPGKCELEACCFNGGCGVNSIYPYGPNPGNSASDLKVPSVFKIPALLSGAIISMPATLAATFFSVDETSSINNATFGRGLVQELLDGRQDGVLEPCDCADRDDNCYEPSCCYESGGCEYDRGTELWNDTPSLRNLGCK